MKKLFIFILLFSSNLHANNSKWNEHFALVNKDIASIEGFATKDLELKIRLFELYGEKLTLLIEVENQLRIEYLKDGKAQAKLNQSLQIQKNTLNKIEKVSQDIITETNDKDILSKVYYYKGLSSSLVKDYKNFELSLLKAEKLTNNNNLKHSIQVKLADHYYNEKNYAAAIPRYRLAIVKDDYKWKAKLLYNLAWCEFKVGQNQQALTRIMDAYKYSSQESYFSIGDQLVDAIMLFHAQMRQTEKAISFLKEHKYDNLDNYLQLAHYVFELGHKPDIIQIFNIIMNQPLTINEKTKVLAKEIEIYRNLKQYKRIQVRLKKYSDDYSKQINNNELTKESQLTLTASVQSYNGLLQEIIKAKGLIDDKRKKNFLSYIYRNFDLLILIDPTNTIEYRFYQGETFFAQNQYQNAIKFYLSAIDAKNKNPKIAKKYLEKTYDSLFKSHELIKDESPSLFLTFENYLKDFPFSNKSEIIFQRLIDHRIATGQNNRAMQELLQYNRSFPKALLIQKNLYKKLINISLDKKDLKGLKQLSQNLQKGFLQFTPTEMKVISDNIQKINFDILDGHANSGKIDLAIKGFSQLYFDSTNTYDLRLNALRKMQYYQHQSSDFKNLSQSLIEAHNYYHLADFKNYQKELYFYLSSICSQDLIQIELKTCPCLSVMQTWKKGKKISVPKNIDDLYFRRMATLGRFEDMLKYSQTDQQRQDYLLQVALLKNPDLNNSIFENFYKLPSIKNQIEGLVQLRFWQLWFSNLNINKNKDFIKNLAITGLKNQYNIILKTFDSFSPKINFALVPLPQDQKLEITFEVFSKYLENLITTTTKLLSTIDESLSKVDHNFRPYFVAKLIKQIDDESVKLVNYKPNSHDPALVKAIKNELVNVSNILKQKQSEYEQFYNQAIQQTLQRTGGLRYRDSKTLKAIPLNMKENAVWQGAF